MTKVLVEESSLQNIASAIRDKLDTETQYKPGEMASAINQIHGMPVLQEKTITQNGEYYADDDNAEGYSKVTINIATGGWIDFETKVTVDPEYKIQTALGIFNLSDLSWEAKVEV